jgi:GNAT superfamily N-acetyltransferase
LEGAPRRARGAPLFDADQEMKVLFDAGVWQAVALGPTDAGALQAFYQANPEYYLTVEGEPPAADAAHETFDSRPPAGWPYERKWVLGFRAEEGDLVGMADLLSNLFIDGVWHIGLFIVATRLHGTGAARVLYDGLEAWMVERGALWSRLGVVIGNARAERFWERLGYVDVRRREGLAMGQRINAIRVMVKPLADESLAHYLAHVARDRPDSP